MDAREGLTENILYAQSGGVTSVINATACGVIKTARASKKFKKVFAAKNGILGVLNEEIIDTSRESSKVIDNLIHTPGGAFGSCRYKLRSIDDDLSEYVRLVDVLRRIRLDTSSTMEVAIARILQKKLGS